jgi:integrase
MAAKAAPSFSHLPIRQRPNSKTFRRPARVGSDPLQIKCGLVDEDGKARYGFRSLCHTAASLFIAHLNWTPKRVQTVMGHSSIAITFDRYGHLFGDHEGDREAMKKLEAAVVAA